VYRYDAVVVGAGPAGAAAARGIAKRGFNVLLLEEHAEIGTPLHCSGLVTPRTLEEASVGEELVLNKVTGAHIYAPSGAQLTLGDGTTRALVIDRVGLDRVLVARAQERGAQLIMGARVVGVEREPGGLTVTVDRHGTTEIVHTRLVIGADGAHSRVARAMSMGSPVKRVSGLGAEGTLTQVDEENVQVFVGTSVAPGWFAWTIPLGQGRVRLGIGSSNGVKPLVCLRRLFETYSSQLSGWQPTSWTGGSIPLWSKRKIVSDNVMLVGDAAGQVKPTSGGGIYPGMVGGRLAADVCADALAADTLTEMALRSYPKAWDKVFSKEFRQGEDLRQVYKSLDDVDLDKLIRLFGRKRLLGLINRYGDIDFPGGMFNRLSKLAPFLWAFVRGPLRHAPLWK
jgi:digeranylgeranylglycerophospholipid reductase